MPKNPMYVSINSTGVLGMWELFDLETKVTEQFLTMDAKEAKRRNRRYRRAGVRLEWRCVKPDISKL